MAWRIDAHVIRGEIDNRTRGHVAGRIWMTGRNQPIELRLSGNGWRDLAGRKLEFVNPHPEPGLPGSFTTIQGGVVGDMTASRKVRVPDVSGSEFEERINSRQPFPWHWGNALYLEWFSETNGRVVIESASFRLTILSESSWEMSEDEEVAQRTANAGALAGFLERLEERLEERAERHGPITPMTEAEAEKLQEDSERLADRVAARMEREGANADYTKILSEELARARKERGEPELTPEEKEEEARWMEEMRTVADEDRREDVPEQWRSAEDEDDFFAAKHPLLEQSFELSVRVMRETEERGWIDEATTEEHPVASLAASIAKAGARLAGALEDEDWPPSGDLCAATLVRLKRATDHLEDAVLAAQSCREERLVDLEWLDAVMREVGMMVAEIHNLIAELRGRLKG